MFAAYVGRPGGGKSYDAVRKIVANLRAGRVVATNIDGMQDPKCQEAIKQLAFLDDYQFSQLFIFLGKDDVTSFWKPRTVNAGDDMAFEKPLVPSGALVVLDEVHKWINCREWNSDKNKEFAEWGAEHRHDGYDVILITQDITKLDKQVRSLVEFTYFYRKINFFGNLIKKRYIKYSYDGDDHEGKSSVSPSTYTYDARYFRCYRSYKRPAIVEKDFQQHINVLKHPVFFAIPVVVGYAIYSLFHSGLIHGDLFGGKNRIKQAQQKVVAAATPNTASAAVIPLPAAVPPPPAMGRYSTSIAPGQPSSKSAPIAPLSYQSKLVTIKGYVKGNGRIVAMLSDGRMVDMKKKPLVDSVYLE